MQDVKFTPAQLEVWDRLTVAQRLAAQRVTDRWQEADSPSFTENGVPKSVAELIGRGFFEIGGGAFMVPFGRMWLGIEPDGYTHS